MAYTYEDERAKLSAAITLLHEVSGDLIADFNGNRENGLNVLNFAGSAAHSAARTLQDHLDALDAQFDK